VIKRLAGTRLLPSSAGSRSGFDGIGGTLPFGVEDVPKYPSTIYGLLKAVSSRDDIKKICAGNLLRAWSNVKHVGTELRGKH